MKQYLIETDHLTKQYGEQKSVSDLSIHVKEGRISVSYTHLTLPTKLEV